jgi:hypothetical protein
MMQECDLRRVAGDPAVAEKVKEAVTVALCAAAAIAVVIAAAIIEKGGADETHEAKAGAACGTGQGTR